MSNSIIIIIPLIFTGDSHLPLNVNIDAVPTLVDTITPYRTYLNILNFYYVCRMLLFPIGHTEYKMYRLIAESILLRTMQSYIFPFLKLWSLLWQQIATASHLSVMVTYFYKQYRKKIKS